MEDDVQSSSLPEVNLRQLRAVLAVAEYRSFIAAAAFLKTSQPALRRTIKSIEGTLGASLFSRLPSRADIVRWQSLLCAKSGQSASQQTGSYSITS
jgi:hypothetical protein